MSEAVQLITQLKESGNRKFQNGQFVEAIHDYSIALQLAESTYNQKKEVSIIDLMSLIYSNRCQCNIKLNKFSLGIEDCNESILLTTNNKNTNYTKLWKTYYRRAICHESVNQLKSALSDLQNANNLWSKYNINKNQKKNTKNKKKKSNNKKNKSKNINNPINDSIKRITRKLNDCHCNDNDQFLNENTFTKQHAKALINNGYVIIDNFFKNGIANCLLFEFESIIKLQNGYYLKPNTTYFKNNKNQIIPFNKPNIWEIDLHSIFDETEQKTKQNANKCLKHMKHKHEFEKFYHLFSKNTLSEKIETHLNGIDGDKWNLSQGNGRYAIKLQLNDGNNGCFPYHIDNPGINKRRITLVVYLNKQWQYGDGGEIVLLPFMDKQVIIAPKFNRCAMFLSETMLHRVLPAKKKRYCFSVWIDRAENTLDIDELLAFTCDDIENKSADIVLGSVLLNKENEWLNKASVQCSLSRWLYQNEYIESLQDCVVNQESDIYKQLYAMHRKHISNLKEANKETGLLAIVEWLENNKPSKDDAIYWDAI